MSSETNSLKPKFDVDTFLDIGDESCAVNPINNIAKVVKSMASGQKLEVRATDVAMSIDIQAWCNMTGNQLVKREDDRFIIQCK